MIPAEERSSSLKAYYKKKDDPEYKSRKREYAKKYRSENRDKIRKSQREWYKENRENIKYNPESRRKHLLKKKYGITQDQYEFLLERQDWKCAICGRDSREENGKSFAVDHCHDSGDVRGILCHSCNIAIGHLRDSQDIVWKAFKYLVSKGEV